MHYRRGLSVLHMNKNLWFLTLAQGLYLTNNVTFIAINGLVGFALAPASWLATLPVMGYVVGSALATTIVARIQKQLGRKRSFQIALIVAFFASLLCAFATLEKHFWLLNIGTIIAGFYNANAQLYRFAAAELADKTAKEKAISWVLAGGILGAVLGPNMANWTRDWFTQPFAGAYVTLAVVSIVALWVITQIQFQEKTAEQNQEQGRPLSEIMRQPLFIVCTLTAALAYGVMNLLMAATPLAMEVCGFSFDKTVWVLEWHVIGMFAPGFVTGHLIKRFGVLSIMGVGVLLNIACIAVALSGVDLHQFLVALFLLGVGWNFLFTGSTTLSMQAYTPQEKNRAQAAINFCVFATMAFTSFASGALVTTQGWAWLNWGSLVPVLITGAGLLWLARKKASAPK